jgi:hypothetical protein
MRNTKSSAKFWLALSITLVMLQSSCLKDGTGPGNQADDRISIVNSASALAAGVTYYPDSTIAIEGSGVGYPSLAPSMNRAGSGRAAAPFKLKLVAEVAPPSIGG